MTYQQAGRIAVLKRILGWVIFIPALIHNIDFFAEIYEYPTGKPGGSMRSCSTLLCHDRYDAGEYAFFESIRNNSLTSHNFNGGVNVMFWVIFILIFVGLALQDSGARMSRQARFLREGVEDLTHSGKSQRGRGANA
ncbi:YniB family protein [Escherichia coli]